MPRSIAYLYKFLIVFTLLLQGIAPAQKVKPAASSNQKLFYEDFITGFKQAWVELDAGSQQLIDQPDGDELLKTIRKYMGELGFDVVVATTSEKLEMVKKATTSCNNADFKFSWKSDGFDVSDISINVSDCNGTWFRFERSGVAKIDYSLERTLLTEWRKLLLHKRVKYDPARAPQLFKGSTGPSEASFKSKLDKDGAKDIEGIYELMKQPGESGLFQKLRIGIEKLNDISYRIYYFAGALFKNDWIDGEYKGEMIKTGKKDFYKVTWKNENKTIVDEVFCSSSEQGILIFQFVETTGTKERRFLKLYPVF